MSDELQRKMIPRTDPRLDWAPTHDRRSLNFAVREKIGVVEERPRLWDTGPVLDQGAEGACVGFGWTAELMASPRPDPYTDVGVGNEFARSIYRDAQRIDEWPGEDYSGTSVLAGAKVVTERGYIDSYRWCFGVDDVRDAVIELGPVVIGIPWYEFMYDTRPSGLVEIGGDLVGGHCLLVTGYHPGMRITGEDWHARYRVFRWRNSWGDAYGPNGSGNGTVRYEDLRDLLAQWGEACVPMGRNLVRLNA